MKTILFFLLCVGCFMGIPAALPPIKQAGLWLVDICQAYYPELITGAIGAGVIGPYIIDRWSKSKKHSSLTYRK